MDRAWWITCLSKNAPASRFKGTEAEAVERARAAADTWQSTTLVCVDCTSRDRSPSEWVGPEVARIEPIRRCASDPHDDTPTHGHGFAAQTMLGALQEGLAEQYRKQLEALGPRALRAKQRDDLIAGFSDGARALLAKLKEMGILIVR